MTTTTASGLDLDAIRRLADAATEGPWRTARPKGLHPWEVCISADVPLVEMSHSEQGIADAEFIVAARSLVPAMADEIERLRADLDTAREELRRLRTERHRDDVEDSQVARRLAEVTAERDRMRDQLFAQRPVIESAEAWALTYDDDGIVPDAAQETLYDAVEQYRVMDLALDAAEAHRPADADAEVSR